MGGKKKVLRTVRSLLRLSKSRSVSGFGKEVSSEILSEYRSHRDVKEVKQVQLLRQKGLDLLLLWGSLDERKAFWKLDAGVEKTYTPSELAAKSARRVGLEIPKVLE